jgi:hypothetical protein
MQIGVLPVEPQWISKIIRCAIVGIRHELLFHLRVQKIALGYPVDCLCQGRTNSHNSFQQSQLAALAFVMDKRLLPEKRVAGVLVMPYIS